MLTIAKYDRYDLINTPKTDKPAFTIWFSGCSMRCEGCYNQALWNKHMGRETEVNTVIFVVCKECDHMDVQDIVLLGGEPMEQDYDDLMYLIKKLNSYKYRIWLYTGWDFESIPEQMKEYLYTIKCGKYDESLKCDGNPSSTNQKFYRKNSKGVWKNIKF